MGYNCDSPSPPEFSMIRRLPLACKLNHCDNLEN